MNAAVPISNTSVITKGEADPFLLLRNSSFKKDGLIIQYVNGEMMTNVGSINRAVSIIDATSSNHEKRYLVAMLLLKEYYSFLPMSIQLEYEYDSSMIEKLARDKVETIVRFGGRIPYGEIQSWIHRYFNPSLAC